MRELCNHLLFLRCNPINSEMKMLSGALFSRSPAAVPHAQSVHHNKRHNVILKFNHHIVCFLKTILLNPKSEEFWTDRPITVPSEGVLPLQTQDHRPLSDLRHCHWGESRQLTSDARAVLSCNALHLSRFSSSQKSSPRCACLLVSHLEQQLFLVDSSVLGLPQQMPAELAVEQCCIVPAGSLRLELKGKWWEMTC